MDNEFYIILFNRLFDKIAKAQRKGVLGFWGFGVFLAAIELLWI